MTKRERDAILKRAARAARDSVKEYRGAEGKYVSSTQGFKDWCYGADIAEEAILDLIDLPLERGKPKKVKK